MKKLFIILSTILLAVTTVTAWAQDNPKLSYQAVVRDNRNRLLTNSSVNVEINILKPNLSVQYTETFANVPTNQNGLMSLQIGNKPTWDNVVWFNAKINVKITLPDASVVESTSDVSAVPLAINALYADSVKHGAIPQSDWNETNPAKSTFIKNKPDVGSAALCDSVKDCVTGWISDSLATFSSTLHTHTNKAILDATTATYTKADSANLKDNYYTKAKINDTLAHYLGTKALDSLITKSGLADTASAIRSAMNTADAALQHNIDTTSQNIRDFVNTTLSAYEIKTCADVMACDGITAMQTAIGANATKISADSVTLAEKIASDSLAIMKNVSDTASTLRALITGASGDVGKLNAKVDSLNRNLFDTLHIKYVTNTVFADTIKDVRDSISALRDSMTTNYVSNADLCEKVKPCVNTQMNGLRDSVNTLYVHTTKAALRDSVAGQIHDSLATFSSTLHTHTNKAILDATTATYTKADSTNLADNYYTKAKINDTLAHYLGTKALDSLITKRSLADTASAIRSAMNTADAALQSHIDSTSQQVRGALVDTAKNLRDAINDINANLCTTVMACADIQKMRDSIQTNKNAIVANAANIATNTANITTNTTDIATLKEHTTKDALCDSVSSCVATAMDNRGYLTKDSTVITTMQTSIGQNATDIESLQSALVGYAKLADANTYTGNNDFTGGTTRVASGFTFGTTTSETCNNIAVNACDLLVVFDSIQKQFAAMQQQIDGLRDSLQRLRGAVVPAFSSMTFDRTENSLTATADFDDGGATITEYNFCISTSEDMSDAICQTSTESTYTFEDLNPGTQYYMTVAATNLKGTITSDTIGEQTVHSAPQLSEATANAISNTEIEVTGTLISMGGTTPTTVTVYAYTNSDYSDAEPIRGTDSIITTAPKEYKVKVDGLTKGTNYYLAVIADNGEKKDTVKTSATTKSVTVVVTSDPEADTIRTGSNVDVNVTYTATVEGVTPIDENGYSWKVNETDSSSVTEELTVHYTAAGTYKVVCTYNGATDTAVTVVVAYDTITFIPNGGTGTMDKQIVKRGVETPLADNVFTHEGWTFKGWNNDYTHTVTYENTANITTDGNIELYAVWATSCTGTASANETGTDGNISSVKDVCDNEYAVIAIGEQCWMKENLRTTKYADNSNILADNMFAPNNVDSNVAVYGRLYNWAAVMNSSNSSTTNPSDVQGVCPNGWHVPSAAEWDILINYVNGQSQYKCSGEDRSIAKAMSAPTGWIYNAGECFAANLEGNNATGFSAVAAGFHNSNEDMYFGRSANFVTSTESDADNVSYRYVHQSQIFENTYTKAAHLSVRCVRNKEHMVTFKTHEGNLIESKAINGTIEFPGIGDSVKREGYNFNGWNTKIDGSGTHFNVGDEITPTSDTTFYTEWFQCGSETSRVYDSENNGYLTAKIGELCYLAENLRTQIGETGNAYPAAESQDSVAKYGMLYDYEAAQGICPPGWKLPTLEELSETTIENFAIKMAGLYTSDGYSNFFGNSAYFWTSDDNSGLTDAAYYKAFFKFSSAEPNSGSMIKTNAASVRCVFSSTNE